MFNVRVWWQKQVLFRVAHVRQRWLSRVLSYLYDQPMMVAPQNSVGVAAALALYMWQDGSRQLVMVRQRPPANRGRNVDVRAKFISCLGMGGHADMAAALRATLVAQAGPVFSRLLDEKFLQIDTVAAVPVLSLTDEDTGVRMPMQVLVWVAEIKPIQLDVVKLPAHLELVLVPEQGLDQPHVSPTHRALWKAVYARHVPKLKAPTRRTREDGVELVDEAVAAIRGLKGSRILH